MIKRLRIKFICINMAIVLLMLILTLGMVLHFSRQSTERESLRMMHAAALTPHPAQPPGGRAPRMPYFILRLTAGGELLSEGGRFFDLTDEALLRELYELASSQSAPMGILSEYQLRYCQVDTPAGKCIVFADITGEMASRRSLLKSCLLTGAASTAAFLLISIQLSGWAVRPVAAAWEQQRQFVSDASHELKTPLTVILTNAELLQEVARAPEQQSQFTENIVVMAREMRGLIENLLELARTDSGILPQVMGPVDLSCLTARTLMPFEPIYFERGLTLSCEAAEGIMVHGSQQHLKQVLEILLDNAQKYASPCGEVAVMLKRQGRGHCLLSISNPGPSLDTETLKNIFKRFYRADEARSRDGSYGLGLPIAESIIQTHHGHIWAESAGGRNTFFVQLPVMKPHKKP